MANRYYVYDLVDPRTNETFYVGKGCGSRKHRHELDALKGEKSAKAARILAIIASGHSVVAITVKSFASEVEAYEFEASRIKELGRDNLLNIRAGGHGGRLKSDAEIDIERASDFLDAYKFWADRGSVPAISLGKHGVLDLNSVAAAWVAEITNIASKRGRDIVKRLALAKGIELVGV